MAYHIVGFEPLERCGLCRIEPELLGLFAEEIALFRVVVEAAGLRLDSSARDFLGRFLFAIAVEPFDDFLIARSVFNLGFEIVPFNALETEQRVIERAIKVIFTDVSRYERAAFIDRSPENCIAADANTWTARRFPC